ncbi:MAG: glycosyl hydrolase [Deltaproteobacteria bacterium]|nr:MAG: glycosyl hydrolase [Deltaproteobacteria bacterium]
MVSNIETCVYTDSPMNPAYAYCIIKMKMSRKTTYKKLEEYGIIGNLETCALIGKDGSVDWCCFPHLESPSVFAAILDVERGGHFIIQPSENFISKQFYIEKTNVLQTAFETESGSVTLVDFMPVTTKRKNGFLVQYFEKIKNLVDKPGIHHNERSIIRKIICTKGSVELKIEFKPRFNYARAIPKFVVLQNGVIARWQNHTLFLQSPIPLTILDGKAKGNFNLKEGEHIWFVLRYGSTTIKSAKECEELLQKTLDYWLGWVHSCEPSKCVFEGPWHDIVVRSGLVLKLLTHPETGAIAAAPTTSIPEEIGGSRNWDYRFSWVRDASFTVQALYNLGHVKEAKDYLKWFIDICRHKSPSKIQVMYGLHGELSLEEEELEHLSGYQNSYPVRIGNAAVKQKQLDIYGELINAIYETTRYGEDISSRDWDSIKEIVDYVCEIWNTKDAGIWEVRGEPQHFTYSKLMCWVALDRGIKIARLKRFDANLSKWVKNKEDIRYTILERGFNKKLNSFVQSLDGDKLDASCLLIPIVGFLSFNDPRVQGTVDAVVKYLMNEKGLVYRYDGEDGLTGKEGTFTLCSFWLVDTLTLSGRIKEAEEIFLNVLKYVSPLGLLAEEIDANLDRQLGNFPQAFSHIGLINSALYLGKAKGKEQMGPSPIGIANE